MASKDGGDGGGRGSSTGGRVGREGEGEGAHWTQGKGRGEGCFFAGSACDGDCDGPVGGRRDEERRWPLSGRVLALGRKRRDNVRLLLLFFFLHQHPQIHRSLCTRGRNRSRSAPAVPLAAHAQSNHRRVRERRKRIRGRERASRETGALRRDKKLSLGLVAQVDHLGRRCKSPLKRLQRSSSRLLRILWSLVFPTASFLERFEDFGGVA